MILLLHGNVLDNETAPSNKQQRSNISMSLIQELSHFSMSKVLIIYSYIQEDWNNVLKIGVHVFIRRISRDSAQLSAILH
jgi:hypothetical protein